MLDQQTVRVKELERELADTKLLLHQTITKPPENHGFTSKIPVNPSYSTYQSMYNGLMNQYASKSIPEPSNYFDYIIPTDEEPFHRNYQKVEDNNAELGYESPYRKMNQELGAKLHAQAERPERLGQNDVGTSSDRIAVEHKEIMEHTKTNAMNENLYHHKVKSSSGNPIDSDRPSLKGPKPNETLFLDSAKKSQLDDPHSSIQNTPISEIMHHRKASINTADQIENNQPSLKESKPNETMSLESAVLLDAEPSLQQTVSNTIKIEPNDMSRNLANFETSNHSPYVLQAQKSSDQNLKKNDPIEQLSVDPLLSKYMNIVMERKNETHDDPQYASGDTDSVS
jgi:hypothetical protein